MNKKAIKEALEEVERIARKHDMTKSQLERELVRKIHGIRNSHKEYRESGSITGGNRR